MARYKNYNYDQMIMVPVSLEDQLIPGSLEYAIHHVVEERLDLSIFDDRYCNDETGRKAIDPKVLIKIVLFGYSRGLISSRSLERACKENITFMALSCGQKPDHSTIAAFVSSLNKEIEPLFTKVLLICDEEDLLSGTHFSLDGLKLSSNAAKEWSGKFEDLKKKQKALKRKVKEAVREHRAADKREGKKNVTDSARRQKRIKRLKQKADRIEKFLSENEPKIGSRGKEIQSNVTDNESAKMATSHGVLQGYNANAVVDEKKRVKGDRQINIDKPYLVKYAGEHALIFYHAKKEDINMPRIARLVVKGEPAVYHVISRTALNGFVLGDIEKDYLLKLIKRLSSVYFSEVLGFCVMGNHFHLLVRMHPGEDYSNGDIRKRFSVYYGKARAKMLKDGQLPHLREKWSSLSEYVKEIKQGFSRFYNKRHGRKGFFWSERFKSVIVDNGETLINCLAYIDLNPFRAGLVKKPEEYRWSSIGYHVQWKNKGGFLSLDFGLREFGVKNKQDRLKYYRGFVYKKGGINSIEKEEKEDFELKEIDRFRYRTRYFTDSGIIGSKEFVSGLYNRFKGYFTSKHKKKPKAVQGLEGIFSLKRLSENI